MYRTIYLCFLFLILFSCEKNTTYNVNGTIIEIHEKDYKLLIDHEKIENFMEPMVMFFNIHKSIDMQTFNINDYVNFDLVITKDSHYSLNFKTINKKEEIKRYDNSDYRESLSRAMRMTEKMEQVGVQPRIIAERALSIIENTKNSTRYRIDPTRMQNILLQLFPKRIADKMIAKRMGILKK